MFVRGLGYGFDIYSVTNMRRAFSTCCCSGVAQKLRIVYFHTYLSGLNMLRIREIVEIAASGRSPYGKPVRVQIIDTIRREDTPNVMYSVADDSGCMKLSTRVPSAVNKLEIGKGVLVSGYTVSNKTIFLDKSSVVRPCGQISISGVIEREAQQLLRPPVPAVITLDLLKGKDVQDAPNVLYTVKGTVITVSEHSYYVTELFHCLCHNSGRSMLKIILKICCIL